MEIKMRLSFSVASCFLATLSISSVSRADSPASPTAETIAQVTKQINSGDDASIAAAEQTIRGWVSVGRTRGEVRHIWLPALMKAKRYQDTADLAMVAEFGWPASYDMSQLMEDRVNALLAMDKPQLALEEAKGYYNVCDIKNTAHAIDLVGMCLAKCHPEDLEIVHRFRNEQAASASGAAAATQPAGMLKGVVIDGKPYEDAITAWASRTKRFNDRVDYGNLLLAADRGDEAEKLFRELYQLATTPADLAVATEGISRSLRAEDGNVGRANAWLVSLQQGSAAATQPG
jgi:hypothetical protein